jgi:hypothetical protein
MGMLMPNEAEEEIAIPRHAPGHREQEIRVRATSLDDGQATVPGLEEFASVSQREAERLLRIPHRFQMTSETIEELEKLEFPLLNVHDLFGGRAGAVARTIRDMLLHIRGTGMSMSTCIMALIS